MNKRRRRGHRFAQVARGHPRAAYLRLRIARPRSLVSCVVVSCMAIAGLIAATLFWNGGGGDPPRAVIIDQLAFTDPNPVFVEEAEAILRAAGYRVDYVPPAEVSVDFYRDLPRRDYDFVLLRSHSSQERTRRIPATLLGAAPLAARLDITEAVVSLFTNEPYGPGSYVDQQRAQELGIMSYPRDPERGQFFGVTPEFVRNAMRGRFRSTTFVLMGCGGLNTTGMAQALIDRGVEHFISWDYLVTAMHTDRATERLLLHLKDGHDAASAATLTMRDVGPDPAFGSVLSVYP